MRILTIHAAKGLEFPVVIVSGMTSRPGRGGYGGLEVLWPRDGGCEFKLRKDLQTREYDLAKPLDEQMDHHERLRLLYVACTRARDHLVVSLHRAARKSREQPEEQQLTNAELLAHGGDGAHTRSNSAHHQRPCRCPPPRRRCPRRRRSASGGPGRRRCANSPPGRSR
ncbi:3'-5' exonuclease [Luedemannella flava]